MTSPISAHIGLKHLYIPCHRGKDSVFWLRLVGTLTVMVAVGVRDKQGVGAGIACTADTCKDPEAAAAACSLASRTLSFALRTAVRCFLVGRATAPCLMLGRSGHVSLSAWYGPWHTAHCDWPQLPGLLQASDPHVRHLGRLRHARVS